MFCTNCGKELPDSVRFCNMCGTPVAPSRQLPPGTYADVQPIYRRFNPGEEPAPRNLRPDALRPEEPGAAVLPERKKGIGKILWLIVLGLVLLLAVTAVLILTARVDSPESGRSEAPGNLLAEARSHPVSMEDAYPDKEWDGLVLWHYEAGKEPLRMSTFTPGLAWDIWQELLEADVKETDVELAQSVYQHDYFSLLFYTAFAEDSLTLTIGERGNFFMEYGGETRFFTSGGVIYDRMLELLPQEDAIPLGDVIPEKEWTGAYLMSVSPEGRQNETVSLNEEELSELLDQIAELELVYCPEVNMTGSVLISLHDRTGDLRYNASVHPDGCLVPVGDWEITCQVEGLYEIVWDIIEDGGLN